MIGTATTVLATAGVVALGVWAEEQKVTVKFIVGTGVYAAALAILGEVNDKFAAQVGLLVFVTAVLFYGPKALQALGLMGPTKGRVPRS